MSAPDPKVVEIACRNVDRLTTVEMRISDYGRGVIANLHRAAREAQGGAPLSLLGARFLLEHVKEGRHVLLTTGAGDPRFLPAGETDGPLGLVVLARAVRMLGGLPVLLTEAPFVQNVATTALAIGLGRRSPELLPEVPWSTAVLPLSCGDDAAAEATGLLDRFGPSLLVSIEKLGPNESGIAHTASGKPTAGDRARAEHLFDQGAARGIPTLGIGDNGNEIGFGKILPAVKKYKPRGEALGTRVATDVLVPANTSNWGGYAICAALAMLTGQPDFLHSADDEERMLRACVDADGVDGSTGRHILQVDGMSLEVQRCIVGMLNGIVRNAAVTGFKRPF